MPLLLPPLPYPRDALEPHLSATTLDHHHGKHQRGYVDRLNALIAGTPLEGRALEAIVREARGSLFNCAAQAWNHAFYWECMKPGGAGEPSGPLADAIRAAFGSFAELKEQFRETSTDLFGSGWSWLVKRPDGTLGLVATFNAGTPLSGDDRPLLTCDVWEHAYYLDHRHERARYVDGFWQLIDWERVAARFA